MGNDGISLKFNEIKLAKIFKRVRVNAMTATLNFMDIVLKTEYEFYQKIKAQLLAEGREGKFVLIKDNSIIGFFEDAKEAYEAGVRSSGRGFSLSKRF